MRAAVPKFRQQASPAGGVGKIFTTRRIPGPWERQQEVLCTIENPAPIHCHLCHAQRHYFAVGLHPLGADRPAAHQGNNSARARHHRRGAAGLAARARCWAAYSAWPASQEHHRPQCPVLRLLPIHPPSRGRTAAALGAGHLPDPAHFDGHHASAGLCRCPPVLPEEEFGRQYRRGRSWLGSPVL